MKLVHAKLKSVDYKHYIDTDEYEYNEVNNITCSNYLFSINIGFTVIAALSPVAGLLTDVRFSRQKAVLCASYTIVVKLIMVFVVALVMGGLCLNKLVPIN